DSNLSQAYAYLAFINYNQIIWSLTDNREQTLQEGIANAKTAIAIDSRDYAAHWALGRLHNTEGDHQSAVRELEISININPNFAHGYFGLAVAYLFAGQPQKTIEVMDMAIRLSPNDPLMWTFVGNRGIAHGVLQEFDKAIEHLEEACRFPAAPFIPFTMLAALYALTGRQEDAEKTLGRARRVETKLSLQHMYEYLGTADQESFEAFFRGFRMAGLTE
ncbi:MAG: tetratricopeptide repeat protein, partial [Woeseiaceae bacterium]|nr:tetratricopeptide repeat protein [Woeseiaceae bacterium]